MNLGYMITLLKQDGRSLEGIKASVRGDKIIFNETDPPLEVGDSLVRKLPNGVCEEFLVLETGYQATTIGGRRRRGSHYHARVQKKPSLGT